MKERFYQIGGICIHMRGCLFRENERLSGFHTEQPAGTVISYVCSLRDKILLPDDAFEMSTPFEKYYPNTGTRVLLRDGTAAPLLSEQIADGVHKIVLSRDALPLWDSNLAMKLWKLPEKLLKLDEFFLHASLISVDGKAILFTAQKQIGKSTQAALWKQYRGAEIINGDRALLWKKEGFWHACGSPYCGTSNICHPGEFPISAIVILHQAGENSVRPSLAREVAAAFLDGCTYQSDIQEQTESVLDAALDVFSHVPCYSLYCLPDESAVKCLADTMRISAF